MKPYNHQIELSDIAYSILKNNMLVYLAMEERTGKTLTAILTAEKCAVKRVLVITKKNALGGWNETLSNFEHNKFYRVINYHSVNKINSDYDLVILDESHNYLSSYPKTSKIWSDVHKHTKNKPIIYLSATPHAQGLQQLYNQLKLSSWTPWLKYKNFYSWFGKYGKPYTIKINGVNTPQYDKTLTEDVRNDVRHLFITKTRKELGFEQEPEDVIHYITLDEITKDTYNMLQEHEILELSVGLLVCDTGSKLRTSLHQIEGGTIKINDEAHILRNKEKINFILEMFGDTESLVIMYNYKGEKTKLEKIFKKAKILQATSNAEGVDLHKYENLVIYSQDFSTARHSQRRARQCNIKREKPIKVHHLLVKNAISSQLYKTVNRNKKNFVDSLFKKSKV